MMKRGAVREALEKIERWHGAVIVTDGTEYEAIPPAYLTDISYIGPREQVVRIESLSDITGDARGWDDLDVQEQDWAVEQVA